MMIAAHFLNSDSEFRILMFCCHALPVQTGPCRVSLLGVVEAEYPLPRKQSTNETVPVLNARDVPFSKIGFESCSEMMISRKFSLVKIYTSELRSFL